MARLRQEEIRRLLGYLRKRIADPGLLAQIEDELRGDYADEFLREPELLVHFPVLTENFTVGGSQWQLRIIPHAHLRMVQHGVKLEEVNTLFQRFVEYCVASAEIITSGPYTIFGRPEPRSARLTLRVDVDVVTDESGAAHVVTVFIGRSDSIDVIEVEP